MKSKSLATILKPASVVFNEAEHTYTGPKGQLYTGCTTISEAWDKSFFLGPWYAKEMAEELKRKMAEVGLIFQENPKPREAWEKIVDACKGAAKRKSEQAKLDGTAAHDWIANHLEARIDPETQLLPTPDSAEAKNAIAAFLQWAKSVDITWLASEEVVSSDDHCMAGKLDSIAIVDGLTYLLDFKTSGQLSSSYLLQCAGYDLMLREMGLQVMGYLIVRIPKDGKPAETLTVTNQIDMQFFRDTFLKQREAHKFYVYMESKFKDVASGKMKVDPKPAEKIAA
jgi:hypothetical protein